uniref:B1248C03.16 protein n=1 Tax=Oryza sativa subsp. japonica TaxID=39947 RepID=Q6MW81_ORYSJ|nr:B1248C03.16 [Oryza sativa Japonica Group]CAE76064.1 B1340F09.2 [Oryza sativa Japonica Group]
MEMSGGEDRKVEEKIRTADPLSDPHVKIPLFSQVDLLRGPPRKNDFRIRG